MAWFDHLGNGIWHSTSYNDQSTRQLCLCMVIMIGWLSYQNIVRMWWHTLTGDDIEVISRPKFCFQQNFEVKDMSEASYVSGIK